MLFRPNLPWMNKWINSVQKGISSNSYKLFDDSSSKAVTTLPLGSLKSAHRGLVSVQFQSNQCSITAFSEVWEQTDECRREEDDNSANLRSSYGFLGSGYAPQRTWAHVKSF